MKKVEAIIRIARAEAVIERLSLIGVRSVYLDEVRGFGRTRGHQLIHKGSPYDVEFVPKARLVWYGDDHDAEAVVRAIEHVARSGELGDGWIFVSDVDGAIDL